MILKLIKSHDVKGFLKGKEYEGYGYHVKVTEDGITKEVVCTPDDPLLSPEIRVNDKSGYVSFNKVMDLTSADMDKFREHLDQAESLLKEVQENYITL